MSSLLLSLIVACSYAVAVAGESSIGCFFSEEVCEKTEWCYDDNVFGKCLAKHGPIDENNFYRYNLESDLLKELEDEMKRLFHEGYRWSHAYTQCILQNQLYSHRFGFDYNPSLCSALADSEKDPDDEVDPQNLAVIRFNPSYLDKHSQFADEWFMPPIQHTVYEQPQSFGSAKSFSGSDMQYDSRSRMKKTKLSPEKKNNYLSRKDLEILLNLLNTENLDNGISQQEFWDDSGVDDDDDSRGNFQAISNIDAKFETPDEGVEAHQHSDGNTDSNFLSSLEVNDGFDQPEFDEFSEEIEDDDNDGNFDDTVYHNGGFKRLHRYDVKKPGPNFMTNLDDFDSTEAVVNEQLHQASLFKLLEDTLQEKENMSTNDAQRFTAEGMFSDNNPSEREEKDSGKDELSKETVDIVGETSKRVQGGLTSEKLVSSERNVQPLVQPADDNSENKNYDVIDTSYAYITVDKPFDSWKEGAEFIKALEKLFQLPSGVFTNIRVENDQVTFKVNSNEVNASSVASQTETMKNGIKAITGRTVTSAGIGNQVKVSVLSLENDNKKLFIVTFIVCGCIAGVLIGVAVVYVVRRHARSREKLQNLAHPETEPSHDYQDLCRQRMANKSNEKPEPIHAPQRIASLSRESEASVRSPSSRSSTSSWSEEPVVSNMDISTGHMVLSYMEDHLKKKDRLDQEWVALCAYEAEPCSVEAATDPANAKKNRYVDVLPFDHSRVVLNDLTNIASSDYINASTITDHDPRNPAYIATQGPLPHTAADFWQMVWEQGSVVIVTLTRLVENGIAMCHRYWPEEGSEVYHIYEVHLVSEHIWCDDYLVRSFYLKNLNTGETRTVTQFHFLSWPDNGIPASVKALLDFRRKVNKSYRGRSCPIVVHCSDGSGRTGTYCLIDMVLNRMAKGAKEIDIAATLEHIRDQRLFMVKTKAQFEFALTSVAEEVHAILKALPQ